MRVFKGLSRPVTAVAFNPEATRLAVGRGEKPVEVWDLSTGVATQHGPALNEFLRDNLRFDSTGRWLFVAGAGHGLLVLDTQTNKLTHADKLRNATELAVSPRGNCLVVYDAEANGLVTFELSPDGLGLPQTIKRFANRGAETWQVRGLEIFPSGDTVASMEHRHKGGKVEAFISQRHISRGGNPGLISFECDAAFFAHGQVKVSAGGDPIAVSFSSVLMIFEYTDENRQDTYRQLKLPNPNRKHITGLAFHPSGRYLAATSNDATVRLHDRDANWAVTKTFDWKIGGLKSIAFSPDGNLAAAGGEKGQIVVWDVDL